MLSRYGVLPALFATRAMLRAFTREFGEVKLCRHAAFFAFFRHASRLYYRRMP